MGGVRSRLPVRIVRGLAAVLSVLVVAGSGYGWFEYRTLGSAVTTVSGVTHSTAAAGQEQNILLVGDDHRPAGATAAELAELSTGDDGGSDNTDTMMVLHVPAGGGAPTVISLPRDSWVDIPGFGKGKLNAAFADGSADGGGDAGGMSLLVQTIQGMTGLTIDHFVRVSLLGFYDIAQVLGPVQVCLNAAVDDPYSGTDLPAGVSTLDAKQALSFVRQRHGLPRGDLDREVRQQYFLAAELQKVMSAGLLLDPGKLSDLMTAVGSAVQTDPQLDLLALAAQAPQLADVTFTTIPVTGTPDVTDAAGNTVSVVAVDWAALPAFLAEIVGEPASYTDAAAAAPASVAVDVVNGTGAAGVAASSATALSALGFGATAVPGDTTTTLTTVTYPAGMEAQAKAVADAVPGAAVVASSAVDGVTLTLGSDGRTVTGTPAAASSAAPAAAGSGLTTSYGSTTCID